jgi:hemerythrin
VPGAFRFIFLAPVPVKNEMEGVKMSIQWTPDLAVGVREIDEQHKELYRRIDRLLEACSHGKGRSVVADTLKFLEEYIVTHFGNEEQYMKMHAYPEYNQHKSQHTYYINSLNELKDLLAKEGPGINLIVKTNHVVVEWLNTHIRKTDTKLGAFLKGKR